VKRWSISTIKLFIRTRDETDSRIVLTRKQISPHPALPMVLRIPGGHWNDARISSSALRQPAARLQPDVALVVCKQPNERWMRTRANRFHRRGNAGRGDHVEPSADGAAAIDLFADPRHR
jgi:hypothetical protein